MGLLPEFPMYSCVCVHAAYMAASDYNIEDEQTGLITSVNMECRNQDTYQSVPGKGCKFCSTELAELASHCTLPMAIWSSLNGQCCYLQFYRPIPVRQPIPVYRPIPIYRPIPVYRCHCLKTNRTIKYLAM